MIQGMVQGMKTLGVQIHVVKTVGELLFEGYRDTMIDIARTIPFVPDGVVPNFTKFAWFYEVRLKLPHELKSSLKLNFPLEL